VLLPVSMKLHKKRLHVVGVYVGAMTGMILSGYLAHYFAWQYIFYVHGKNAHIYLFTFD